MPDFLLSVQKIVQKITKQKNFKKFFVKIAYFWALVYRKGEKSFPFVSNFSFNKWRFLLMTKCKKCKCEGMKAKANQKVVKPVEHPKFTGLEGLMFHRNWVRLARLNDEIREKLNSMIAERDRLNADIQFFTRIDHYLNHELNSMKCLDSRQVKDNSPELEKQSELYNV